MTGKKKGPGVSVSGTAKTGFWVLGTTILFRRRRLWLSGSRRNEKWRHDINMKSGGGACAWNDEPRRNRRRTEAKPRRRLQERIDVKRKVLKFQSNGDDEVRMMLFQPTVRLFCLLTQCSPACDNPCAAQGWFPKLGSHLHARDVNRITLMVKPGRIAAVGRDVLVCIFSSLDLMPGSE